MLLFYCLILTENWDKIIEYKADHCHGHGVRYEICCGQVYQNTSGIDDPQRQISLVYHIEDAAAVKSKSMNLWPIQCFVVALPPNLQYCFSSTLVCGLSCTPTTPDLKVFQERFVTELEHLRHFQVKIWKDFAKISIKRVILHGHLADLLLKPHLCVFANMMARVAVQFVCTLGEESSMGRAVSVFIHTPFRNHLDEHTIKHSCMHRQQIRKNRETCIWR